jgi:type IV pilus assembly protein PilP
MKRNRANAALAAVAALPLLVLACGSEEISTAPPPAPVAPKPVASAAPSATVKAGPEYAESDFVENDRNRDPFRSYAQIFQPAAGAGSAFTNKRKVKLAQFGLDELKLVAIVKSADYPRAMVIDPRGHGTILQRGDYVAKAETVHTGGTNGADYQVNWRIDRIRTGEQPGEPEDMVLIREDPAQPNVPPATRIVPLHTESEDKNADALQTEDEGM